LPVVLPAYGSTSPTRKKTKREEADDDEESKPTAAFNSQVSVKSALKAHGLEDEGKTKRAVIVVDDVQQSTDNLAEPPLKPVPPAWPPDEDDSTDTGESDRWEPPPATVETKLAMPLPLY
jgi:hypothetical protein